MAAVRFIVRGKVQGVSFRASTREEAMKLDLRGHARNMFDGRVEVLAIGDVDRIETLAEWLHHGPPMAQVYAIERIDVEADAPADEFEVL